MDPILISIAGQRTVEGRRRAYEANKGVIDDALYTSDQFGNETEMFSRQLVKVLEDRMARSIEEGKSTALRAIVSLGAIVMVIIAVGYITIFRISRSLTWMSGVMRTLAARDISLSVPEDYIKMGDEIGQMARDAALLLESLRSQISAMSGTAETIDESAAKMAATITQVAVSTEENYSAIAESSTSMEEIRATTKAATKRMEDVTQLTREGLEMVIRSNEAVMGLLDSLKTIMERMNFISDTIVNLNDKSREIMEVADTVEDLAEQSNLLAVNAAVEAARSSDGSKGFSVVAQEIKDLAEQSKRSAKEVKRKLEDVQRATSSAVMATEQGMRAISDAERGTDPVKTSMDGLARQLGEISQMAAQILKGNQDLFVGVEQVNLALEQIRTSSKENVQAMKELEAASRGLKERGESLKNMVKSYRV